MNQVWNIFRKDVRHHWPEIAATLALLTAFAWLDARSWHRLNTAVATGFSGALFSAEMLPGLVNALLPLSWIFLIVRVVQDESLVGDRQFWVTRPYDWKRLLTAKALFVLAFVNFPLLVMDAILLARAGFHPTHYIVGLLWIQLMWIFLLFLAAAALATVTKNIPQMLLAVLLLVLNVIGASALSSIIHKSNLAGGFSSSEGLLVISVAVAIILIQYSRRKTALSRWLIVGICALLTLISVASSRATPEWSAIAQEYPLASGSPFQPALMHPDKQEGKLAPMYNGEVSLTLPVTVSAIPDDSILRLDGMIVTLNGANGARYDSGWKPHSEWLFPDQNVAHIAVQITQSAYDQLNSRPVTTHLLLAFTVFQDKNRRPFTVPAGAFTLPDVGRCRSELQYAGGILHCLAPLRRPAFLLITSARATSTCSSEDDETRSNEVSRAFVQGAHEPAEMGISPIRPVDINFSNWNWSARRFDNPGICPGTPLTLSNPEETGPHSVELQTVISSLSDFRERLPAVR